MIYTGVDPQVSVTLRAPLPQIPCAQPVDQRAVRRLPQQVLPGSGEGIQWLQLRWIQQSVDRAVGRLGPMMSSSSSYSEKSRSVHGWEQIEIGPCGHVNEVLCPSPNPCPSSCAQISEASQPKDTDPGASFMDLPGRWSHR